MRARFINLYGFLLCVVVVLFVVSVEVEGKDQYVEPLNMGMKVTVPWDIANIFNRYPIQGSLSVALTVTLMAILFFGVITAPFGYFFGIPSQKYVLGDLKFHEETTKAPSRWTQHQEDYQYEDEDGHADTDINIDVISHRMDIFPPPPQAEADTHTGRNSSPLHFGIGIGEGVNYIYSPLIRAPRSLSEDVDYDPGPGHFWRDFLADAFHLDLDLDQGVEDDTEQTSASTSGRSSHSSGSGADPYQKVLDGIWSLYKRLVSLHSHRDFMESLFYWMPPSPSTFEGVGSVRAGSCDLLTLCYAHGALKRLPTSLLTIYQLFSGKLSGIGDAQKEAILQGMEDESLCVPLYSHACSENPFTIVLKSYLALLPKVALGAHVPKRKQAMYL